MSDSEDVGRLRRRSDIEAFARLFDRHSAAVFRYAAAISGDRQHAEDILQETFLTLWRRRKEVEVHGSSVLPWLLVTGRNHARNLERRLQRQGETRLLVDHDTPTHADPGDIVVQRAALHAIAETVAGLSPTDRALVEACILDDLPYRDAAARVGLTPSATARRVQRIRLRFRQLSETQ